MLTIECLKTDILEYRFLGEMLSAPRKACKLCEYHKKCSAQVFDRDLLYQVFVFSILPSAQPGAVALPGNSEFHKFLLLLISSLTLPNTIIQNKIILRYTNLFVNLHSIYKIVVNHHKFWSIALSYLSKKIPWKYIIDFSSDVLRHRRNLWKWLENVGMETFFSKWWMCKIFCYGSWTPRGRIGRWPKCLASWCKENALKIWYVKVGAGGTWLS